MMITRDNYEEFFLLYIDNELSVADREAVEQFVAHHPDLQEEWKAILHCRLLPDEEFVFPDKEALYRTEALEEEEDDEFLHYSPDLSIVFPDKASLYKREKDERIIWLPWLRAGAAAAAAGIVALLVLFSGRHTPASSAAQPIAKNNKSTPPVTPAATGALYSLGTREVRPAAGRAANKPMKEKEKVKVKTSGQDVREEAGPVSQDLAQQTEPHDPVHDPVRDPVHDPATARPTDVTATRAADIAATRAADIAATKATDVTATRAADIAATKAADIAATRAAVATANINSSDAVAALQTGIPREESSFATQALQHENENHDPENNILVADVTPAPAKGKLRGLFRKVTRTFGKTADRDDDGQREVLIGAFQFALK